MVKELAPRGLSRHLDCVDAQTRSLSSGTEFGAIGDGSKVAHDVPFHLGGSLGVAIKYKISIELRLLERKVMGVLEAD